MKICVKCAKPFTPHLFKPLTICDKCADSLTVEIEKRIALAKENKTFEGVTDGDQFLFEATAITESPDKAKERYEAAIEFLGNQFPETKKIQQALKIAAGIL